MITLDCKKVRDRIIENVREKTLSLKNKGQRAPSLAVILVGSNAASVTYVKKKKEAALSLGFIHNEYVFDEKVSESEILSLIDKLNSDDGTDAILVQLPLPSHINESSVMKRINHRKDVDGFSPINAGLLLKGERGAFIPCTAKGIVEILKYYEIETRGKNVAIIGRSNIVGKPLAALLMSKEYDATVTVLNSRTENIKEITLLSDIVVVATGCINTIDKSYVRRGATVIDVGINRIEDSTKKAGYKIVGDVDYNSFKNTDVKITPVPGGVGLLTVAALMENTLIAREGRNEIFN